MTSTRVIAVSMGDPLGIGPEVLLKAVDVFRQRTRAGLVIIGASDPLERAAKTCGIPVFWTRHHAWPSTPAPGEAGLWHVQGAACPDGPPRATAEGGALSFRWVDEGIASCLSGRAAALVTAPINKEAWALAGHGAFPGHTELIETRCRAVSPDAQARMMFVAPNLRVLLVTTHQPLSSVSGSITERRVLDTILLAHACGQRLGVARPRVAVCGLNPHASEHGLFGAEEARAIEPAILSARRAGIDATGPHPGDTVFGAALRGRFDIVVAMYHDQGLIPVKLLAFDSAVNVTVGLPIIRTSPDHGTAYDIAGEGRADPGSMLAALELAERLADSTHPWPRAT